MHSSRYIPCIAYADYDDLVLLRLLSVKNVHILQITSLTPGQLWYRSLKLITSDHNSKCMAYGLVKISYAGVCSCTCALNFAVSNNVIQIVMCSAQIWFLNESKWFSGNEYATHKSAYILLICVRGIGKSILWARHILCTTSSPWVGWLDEVRCLLCYV